ncbi:MAG: HAMP domain-containing histidine kinase [Labilithrix sp.]|nr:HAMP domain-containing histidine kinase [Labilithrix sp.]MCW5813695.1 HAMP domain-containing histidine kinase [Labilithrix sp.]
MTSKGLGWTAAHIKTAASPDEVKSAIAEARGALGDEPIPASQVLDALEEIAQETARVRADLRAATRAREVLLASVAHDLRNPLNTFAMSTGLLRDDLEAPDFERARATSLVSRMERASTRMQRLIDDLLEASRIEAGSVEVQAKPENAAALLRVAVEKAKPLAADKGASVEEGPADDSVTVTVDRAHVVDALTKLVSVALKSTGEGGVIRLGMEKQEAKVAFTVRGTAPRAAKSVAPDESRGGLALLIARGLITAHGGTIATETTPEGARMLVLL